MCEGPSLISGPIPPDPTLFPEYYKGASSARGRLEGNHEVQPGMISVPMAGFCSARRPTPSRIVSSAALNRERSQKGMVGVLLQLEGVSLNPHPPKQKQQARDYGKENVRRMREIQKRCREKEAERVCARPTPVKALWTSPKYQDVPSKVMAQLQNANPPKRPECQKFLKAHSHNGSADSPRLSRSVSSNSSGDLHSQMQVFGRQVDFLKHNARAAGKTVLRRSQSLQNLASKQPKPSFSQKGQIPQYLEERKEQWRREEEERRKNAPDPSVPAGHTLMPERERQETLQSLKDTQRSLIAELLSLPVRADTLSIQTRRAHLDRRLSEVEEAVKVFSRDKVFVKTDS